MDRWIILQSKTQITFEASPTLDGNVRGPDGEVKKKAGDKVRVKRKAKMLPRFLVVTDKFDFKIIEAENKNKAALLFVSKVYNKAPGDYRVYVTEMTAVNVSIVPSDPTITVES